MITLIGRPPTPPEALTAFSARRIPLRVGPPRPAPGPVMARIAPILMGSPDACCAWATPPEPTPIAASVATAVEQYRRRSADIPTVLCFMPVSLYILKSSSLARCEPMLYDPSTPTKTRVDQ
jgi:hypothetical protein